MANTTKVHGVRVFRDMDKTIRVKIKRKDGTVSEHEAFPIAALAAALGKANPHTIRQWEYKGIIPPPLTQALRGSRRYYLREEIEVYVRVYIESGAGLGVSFLRVGFPDKLRKELYVLKKQLIGEA